jgi:Plasmid encoded RepA protein
MAEQIQLFTRPVDIERFKKYLERKDTLPDYPEIGFLYNVLCQCFMPYRDPGVSHWERRNGRYSVILSAGAIHDPSNPENLVELGLPYGPKPRLFLCHINSLAVKRRSPIVPIARSMSAMLEELGLGRRGGPRGSIKSFKRQVMKLASCNFTIVGPGPRGGETYTKAPPIKSFNVWLPNDGKTSVWPSEIILTDDFFQTLVDHAVPYDVRALRSIQNNARAIDIFLWLTHRLYRLSKPLLMKWPDLFELFGGGIDIRNARPFKKKFRDDLQAARLAYPSAKMEETSEGFLFHHSPTLVPRTFVSLSGLRAVK